MDSLSLRFVALSMKGIFYILRKLELIVVAIQLMNLSFNNLNCFYSDNSALSFEYSNQIDSAFEFITEHILGWENFVPENNHNPNHQVNHFHKAVNLCWYTDMQQEPQVSELHQKALVQIPVFTSIHNGFLGDINPPPPKASFVLVEFIISV